MGNCNYVIRFELTGMNLRVNGIKNRQVNVKGLVEEVININSIDFNRICYKLWICVKFPFKSLQAIACMGLQYRDNNEDNCKELSKGSIDE